MQRFQATVDAEWRRLYPGVEVRLEHIPGSGEYVSKMLTAFVAGTEPDVMSLDASSAAVFIDNNCLRDLAPLAQRDHVDLEAYWPNVLALARRGERLFALPADFTPMLLYYNRRHFHDASLQYPADGWTWRDFRTACERLTVWPAGAPHPVRYGFVAENWMPGWITWIWQNGGDVLDPTGTHATGWLDSPATVEAVSFFAGLVRDHLAPSLSAVQAQGADPFLSGQASMMVSGHWSIVGIRASETLGIDSVGVVGLPRNRRRVTVIYEMGYAVTRRTRYPEAAWNYAKFMSGPFVQRQRAELGIGISGNRAIAESRRGMSALEGVFLDNVRYGQPPWGARVEGYAQVEDIGTEMMDAVLLGNQEPRAALHEAAVRIDAELSA